MDVQEIQKLNSKLEMLLNIQKELAREIKKANSKELDLEVELDKINKKIQLITVKLDSIMNSRNVEFNGGHIKRSLKDFSDEEIYNMRQSSSLRKTADYLNCSVSSVQRICRRYKANNLDYSEYIEL